MIPGKNKAGVIYHGYEPFGDALEGSFDYCMKKLLDAVVADRTERKFGFGTIGVITENVSPNCSCGGVIKRRFRAHIVFEEEVTE